MISHAPARWRPSTKLQIGVAVTAGGVTGVMRRAGADAAAVLVDGWPTQTLDTRDDEALAAAMIQISQAVDGSDEVVIAHPPGFGPARIHRLRAAATTGWQSARTVAAPVALGIARTQTYQPGPVLVIDTTAERGEATVLVPQTEAMWGRVAATARAEPITDDVAALTHQVLTAADTTAEQVRQVVVIATPPHTADLTDTLHGLGLNDVQMVSPVLLATDAITADITLTSHRPGERVAAPQRWWVRPVSSLACGVAATAALFTVTAAAEPSGVSPDLTTCALACVGLATSIAGLAGSYAAHLTGTHPQAVHWSKIGRVLVTGAGIAVAAVITAIVIVAGTYATDWWPLVAAGGAAALPTIAGLAVIGAAIGWHPDQPPERHLWPPVAAMSAVCIAAVFVHDANPGATGYVADGWQLLPLRVGIGVWIFAVCGLIVSRPSLRLAVGGVAGVAAALVATPGTVPVFAIATTAIVSGWWLVTATAVVFDHRHAATADANDTAPNTTEATL